MMKKWALFLVGYTMVVTSLGGLLWLSWEFVGLLAVLLVGTGLASTGRDHSKKLADATWQPENDMQVAERLWDLHSFNIEDAHKAVGLARDAPKGNLKPLDTWKLIHAILENCPPTTTNKPRYLISSLNVLRGM